MSLKFVAGLVLVLWQPPGPVPRDLLQINLEIRCDLVTHNYPQTNVMHPPQPVSCSAMTHLKLHVIVVVVITVAVVAGEDVETCPQPGHVHSSFAVIGAKRRLPSFLHLVAIGPQLEELMGLGTQPVYTGQIVLRQMINQNCAQGIAHNIDGGTEAIE